MSQHYSNPDREQEPTALPDIEVFQLTATEVAAMDDDLIYEYLKKPEFRLATMNSKTREAMLDAIVADNDIQGGYFWHSCFPGCLPDSDPNGPFLTKALALADAQSFND